MQRVIRLGEIRVFAVTLLAISGGAVVDAQERSNIGVYVAFEDAFAKSLEEVLVIGPEAPDVSFFDSLGEAAASDTELVVLAMPRGPRAHEAEVLAALKEKKVIAMRTTRRLWRRATT